MDKMNAEAKVEISVKDQIPIKMKKSKRVSIEKEAESSNGHSVEKPKPLEKVPEEHSGNGVKSVSNGKSKTPKPDSNGKSHNGNSEHIVIDIADDDSETPISEHDNDELFPELNYDEEELPYDEDVASPEYSPVGRSMTRRSQESLQAKKIPTPETPQPKQFEDPSSSSSRPPSRATPQPDHPMALREKVLRLKEGMTPRRDSTASDTSSSSRKNKDAQSSKDDKEDGDDLENGSHVEDVHTKTDTNFSKSRIKVSPYRRSMRISEQYSTIANYSGNNSTQDTDLIGDISSSSRDRSPALDSDNEQNSDAQNSYSNSMRNIKGRKSYKPLREVTLRHLSAQKYKKNKAEVEKEDKDVSISSVNATVGSELDNAETSSTKWTPVGHVVGRKRRPEDETISSPALILSEGSMSGSQADQPPSKRMRLLGFVATPFRHIREKVASSTPIFSRHTQARNSFKVDPLITTETVADPKPAEPMVAEIVTGKAPEEQKWCSIM